MAITIELPGLVRGKGRPRVTIRGAHAHAYTDAKTASYEGALRMAGNLAMAGSPLLQGPLGVVMLAIMPIPASWSKKKKSDAAAAFIRPTSKPDCDNILKCCDALNGVVWGDDAQIVSASIKKVYGASPMLRIEIYQL